MKILKKIILFTFGNIFVYYVFFPVLLEIMNAEERKAEIAAIYDNPT